MFAAAALLRLVSCTNPDPRWTLNPYKMHRIKHHKCFVPSCSNTSLNQPTTLFIRVSETVKKKWCRQVKVEYDVSRRIYCCEDHLNLEEDLENYTDWKMHNKRPIIKPTAMLHNISSDSSELIVNEIENLDSAENEETSVLRMLLSQEYRGFFALLCSIPKPTTSKRTICMVL